MSARKAKRQPRAQTVIETNKAVCAAHAQLGFRPSPTRAWRYVPIAGAEPLKSCPFCDSDAHVELIEKPTTYWARVKCSDCGVHGPEADGNSEGDDDSIHGLIVEAARMWNARGKKWGAA